MCRDMEYEVGKKYVFDGEIELCKAGYHACHELWQVLGYYANDGTNVFYEVECGGKIIESNDDVHDKFVCSEIELVKEVKEADMGVFADVLNVYDVNGFIDNALMLVRNRNLKWNVVVNQERLMFDEWQDNAMSKSNNVIAAVKDNKYSVYNIAGERLFENLDAIGTIYINKGRNRVFEIRKEGKVNWLYDDGTLFSDVWFDRVYYEYEDMASIQHFVTSCIAESGECIWRLDFKDKSIDIIFGGPKDRKVESRHGLIPADCIEVSIGDVIRFPEEKEEVLAEVVNVAEMFRPVAGVVVKYTKGRNGMTKLSENAVYENMTTGKMIKGFHFSGGWCGSMYEFNLKEKL